MLAGRRCNAKVQGRAQGFGMMARKAGHTIRFWRARRSRRALAAAMVLDTPGRAGMLFYSPPSAPGVSRSALVRLVRTITHDAIAHGAAFVQTTVNPSSKKDPRTLTDAGMVHLADLIDMRLDFDLSVPPPPPEPTPWRWRDYEHFTEAQLGDAILATYEQSLDCPLLKGLRSGADIVAGHRTTGVFSPTTWWIVDAPDGGPAGCLLVNDVANERIANIVYLGVLPASRGLGLGRTMLRHAQSVARQRDKLALTLAVDTRNTYAHNTYLREGFVQTFRRTVYVACAPVGRALPPA